MSDLKMCECCGHPLPTLEVQLELTRLQRAMYVVLQKAGQAGLPPLALIERVYGDRPDGGPLSAQSVMHVQRYKMQPKLAKFGMKIVTTKGHDSAWRLETVLRTERSTKRETANAQA